MAVQAVDPGAILAERVRRRAVPKRRRIRNWPLLLGGVLLLAITAACLAAPLLTMLKEQAG